MNWAIINHYLNIFFAEIQLNKQNLRSAIRVLEFGPSKQYTGLPNGLDTSLQLKSKKVWELRLLKAT